MDMPLSTKKWHTFSKPHFCYDCEEVLYFFFNSHQCFCVQVVMVVLQLHPQTQVKQGSVGKVNSFIGQPYRWKKKIQAFRQTIPLESCPCSPVY